MEYFIKGFQNYFNFTGRSTRIDYWYYQLVYTILAFVLLAGEQVVHFELTEYYIVICFIPNISISIRRIHDVGKSGWFTLIPLYNLYLYLCPSDGDNKWGTKEPII